MFSNTSGPLSVERISEQHMASQPSYGTDQLTGRVAVVTGASSGVGRAIALALAQQGARLCAVGRNRKALAETVAAAQRFSSATSVPIDLSEEEGMQLLFRHLEETTDRVDILVHSAGVVYHNPMQLASIGHLDRQYAVNLRAPYLISQRLLPLLVRSRGQIVFVNSSAALAVRRPEVGQYAATKYALKAIADSLREELNPKGVRVLTIYLGRTATPMQEALCRQEGRDYHPEILLQAKDVASIVVHALMLPPTAEVTDISIRPLAKSEP
jgi:NAD(P)-dependent dehydrogenase (short-subunit alcohol dehydrogenase family)